MSPHDPRPGSPAEWLRHARSDLAIAELPLPPNALYNGLCFNAQQAAETSIKAALVRYQVRFRKVHDLGYLVALLPPQVEPPPAAERLVRLTDYATIARYPGDYEDVTEEEYRDAVSIARAVYTWAEQIIGST